ncbi:2741_t:CDS:10 [Acaulospora morrowiae]|uniref:2741_t:CDS:1 n=1 Tax=Acaulospora morrowiae TaxID=94023 RepID=A0A9N8V043_9GLOM|nr:2741_t:CDS:10 [Acaulospora morrowiae]
MNGQIKTCRVELPELVEIPKPPKKGFRKLPTMPTREELLSERPENIPVNKIDEPYESIEEYLETHYRLLREDFICSLREGIKLHREPKKDDDARTDLRVYENVNLVGVTFASMGVVHRISFRTQNHERVKWSMSKRLIPGTLIVLTNDNFSTMKLATVINRPDSLLEKSHNLQIDILFRPEDVVFELPGNYIMVESISSYFEAYRHILKVLQELDPETLPFKSHIIELDPNIEIPKYLKNRIPQYDFGESKAFRDIKKLIGTTMIDISKDWDEWPDLEDCEPGMHSSQYEALKRILTKQLSLVQGPPGTGKTYAGLTAVEILLRNSRDTLVIACQTNHALDQFLEGILEFEEDIVRLGSRTKSSLIAQYTLYEKSKKDKIRNPQVSRLYGERHKIESAMEKLCKEIFNPFVDIDFIIKNQILTESQIESLKQDDWVIGGSSNKDGEEEKNHIEYWVDSAVVTYSSTHDEIEFQVSQSISGIEGGMITKGNYADLKGDVYVSSATYVTKDELSEWESVEDLWSIPPHVRAALHNKWRRQRLDEIKKELKSLNEEYSELSQKIKTEKIRVDVAILKSARVVGMTTTAAAKYHELLVNLKPKIIIIEEAAETLEAHIITALTPYTEHLILIGDHKQLRPNTSIHDLAEYSNLDVSLFERLVKFLPFTQLTEQRRMRPEIRELLTPIYGDTLTDHENVTKYPNVPGFFENLYFFDHIEEETTLTESMSKINKFEADMCAKFAVFLVNGNYDPERITILSMYSGQRKLIETNLRNESRKLEEIKSVRVSSVDGFQGEENDIIILSLVRSREPRRGIGFLNVSNRVCVALSRARHGMYIFGNATQLQFQSELWKNILKIFSKSKCLEQFIDIYCTKHSDIKKGFEGMVTTSVTWAGEIPSSGGCNRKCGEIMKCGHVCYQHFFFSPSVPKSNPNYVNLHVSHARWNAILVLMRKLLVG